MIPTQDMTACLAGADPVGSWLPESNPRPRSCSGRLLRPLWAWASPLHVGYLPQMTPAVSPSAHVQISPATCSLPSLPGRLPLLLSRTPYLEPLLPSPAWVLLVPTPAPAHLPSFPSPQPQVARRDRAHWAALLPEPWAMEGRQPNASRYLVPACVHLIPLSSPRRWAAAPAFLMKNLRLKGEITQPGKGGPVHERLHHHLHSLPVTCPKEIPPPPSSPLSLSSHQSQHPAPGPSRPRRLLSWKWSPSPLGDDDLRLAGLRRVQLTQMWSEPRNKYKVLSLIPGGEEVETEKKESTKTSRTFRDEKCNCAI